MPVGLTSADLFAILGGKGEKLIFYSLTDIIMFSKSRVKISLIALMVLSSSATVAYAIHSWGGYHWARQSNPFTLKVVDSVTSQWDTYLDTANADWSASSILDLTKEPGSIDGKDRRRCTPVAGKIRACNATYGNNGWLGLAQIWVSADSHIAQGIAKMNDTYFNKSYYNTAPWRKLVMCQEIAHDFGLNHQDEDFYNANLGSCMDYTNDPDGGVGGAVADDPSNEHPNLHDYDQLETIYNAHLDATTLRQTALSGNHGNVAEWGKSIRQDGKGKTSLYERDLGKGDKVITFVIWAE